MKAFGVNLKFFEDRVHVDEKDAGAAVTVLDRENQDALRYTPDMEVLQQKQSWWVFVPDEAMSKHHMSWIMDPAEPKYEAFTAGEDWVMFRKYLGQKTVAVPMLDRDAGYVKNIRLNGERAYPAARIRGQMFLIEPKHFVELDNYKQNGVVFKREQVNLLIPYTELVGNDATLVDRVQFIQAWMYQGIPEFWHQYGDDGGIFQPTKPVKAKKLGKTRMDYYYQFGVKDYQKDKATAPSILKGAVAPAEPEQKDNNNFFFLPKEEKKQETITLRGVDGAESFQQEDSE